MIIQNSAFGIADSGNVQDVDNINVANREACKINNSRLDDSQESYIVDTSGGSIVDSELRVRCNVILVASYHTIFQIFGGFCCPSFRRIPVTLNSCIIKDNFTFQLCNHNRVKFNKGKEYFLWHRHQTLG